MKRIYPPPPEQPEHPDPEHPLEKVPFVFLLEIGCSMHIIVPKSLNTLFCDGTVNIQVSLMFEMMR